MKIVADENMPLVEEFFSGWGAIERVSGRAIGPEHVRDADLLLVRSVTPVNSALLEGSNVRFVGTATIGTDHIDLDYLQQRNIGFSAAPGCNAQAVVQYVFSVLALACDWRQCRLKDLEVGIVGAGNVGGLLYRQLTALGVKCLISDPFLDDPSLPLCSLTEVLQSSDVVSLHTPLTKTGKYPTKHLVNRNNLPVLKRGALLINSGRGPVIDEQALLEFLLQRGDLRVALDVWETEPGINRRVLQQVDIATPHIAGYSLEGRLRGTEMIYQAACEYFEKPEQYSLAQLMPSPSLEGVRVQAQEDAQSMAFRLARLLYDVRDDDLRMRRQLAASNDVALLFDRLRKEYPLRRENSSLEVEFDKHSDDRNGFIFGLGFNLVGATSGPQSKGE
ncbi:4-phosphoerythronate dehydrogenase PdxB [Aestuariirhabdus sp. Z084]|uniref:4-phosphoerythronate dehydrogenase PdxB n=1 Tax=Aestuariirhabdus haliotis TaxID=2918751 RepID=UPI00201B3885|nr:4-phosphoerythronate dehydrogenase PdxB [Aestuariirhabdus haliotis]MCL6415777.1 4-phosphoerythronate dehydrogenase PdxB [Aestuariirhabdus haliotis]MCL6419694.1 4-phosphoerythronate dehydrogenase PdxB [Aestuariirhabdus haliotis]